MKESVKRVGLLVSLLVIEGVTSVSPAALRLYFAMRSSRLYAFQFK